MNGLVKPLFFNPLKHVYKLLNEPNYLSYNKFLSQLSHHERYHECQVRVNGHNLLIPDAASFVAAYKEIFLNRIYKFKAKSTKPKILDLGANVGLSIIFFKELYPDAKIVALEADPKIFTYLENNIHERKYNRVKLINKAVWHENSLLHFASEGADSGQVSSSLHDRDTVEVEAIDIAELLSDEQFDFIKMDIEGAEEFVIPRCQGLLNSVRHFFIEYHSKVGHKQNLDRILNFLSQEGFRFYMDNPCQQTSPFLGLNSYIGFDFQINIYAWREESS